MMGFKAQHEVSPQSSLRGAENLGRFLYRLSESEIADRNKWNSVINSVIEFDIELHCIVDGDRPQPARL
jgi:hypothetical protein